ncbi:antirestriction protein [Mycobacteroides abscessus subsp. massiliense]|nr:antirestriction protein [Mycobacteroides abscessus subsp. massiliense]
MLAQSPEENAEEFAIHDYDQFGSCRINEFDSIEKVSRIARGIKEYGEAFAAWAELHDGDPERLDDYRCGPVPIQWRLDIR